MHWINFLRDFCLGCSTNIYNIFHWNLEVKKGKHRTLNIIIIKSFFDGAVKVRNSLKNDNYCFNEIMKNRIKLFFVNFFKIILVLGFIYYVTKDVSFSSFDLYDFKSQHFFLFFLVTLGLIPHLLLLAFLWQYILKFLGQNLDLIEAWRISSIASLGRYLPGKIWLFVGKIAMSKQLGLDIKRVSSSLMFEIIGNVIGAFFVFVLFLLSVDQLFDIKINKYYLLLFVPITSFLVYPNLLINFLNFFLKLSKKEIVSERINIKNIIFLITVLALDWIYQGFLFSIIVSFFGLNLFENLNTLIFINAASWLIGFLSVMSPGGIGIREGVMIELLSDIGILKQNAIQISIMARIWMTVPEFIIAGYFLIKRKSKDSIK